MSLGIKQFYLEDIIIKREQKEMKYGNESKVKRHNRYSY